MKYRHLEKGEKTSVLAIVLMIIISFLIYFFLGIKYDISFTERVIIGLMSLSLFYYYGRKGFSHFSLFVLTGLTTFTGLATAFSSSIVPGGLIKLNIALEAWPILIITLIFSLIIMSFYEAMRSKEKYELLLFVVLLVYWVLIAINAKYVDGWVAENALVVPFLIIIVLVSRWFRFSKLSYSLIFLFMVLHILGSHYTYSEVPLGYWMQEFFGLTRNHYDRLVHFSFGLLWAYPLREIFKRIGQAKGFWSFWIPVELVLALSCIFELIEWGVAITFGGDLGIAYLGTQGDIWDAQKDMALAGLGSIVIMILTALVIIYYDSRAFFSEFKESLKVKEKQVLGEEAIIRLLKKK